jgi:hypothetical protein
LRGLDRRLSILNMVPQKGGLGIEIRGGSREKKMSEREVMRVGYRNRRSS